jgi:hypothetical protein
MTMRSIFFLLVLIISGCKTAPDKNLDSEKLNAFTESFAPGSMRGRRPAADPLSDSSFQAAAQLAGEQLEKLYQIDTAFLSDEEVIDWKFAHSLVSGRVIELGGMKFYKRDPRIYLSFTGISDVIARPGDTANKIETITDRLRAVPVQLANAKIQLTEYVPRFQELSLFMAENGLLLFDRELPEFIKVSGKPAEVLVEPGAAARSALVDFIRFLKTELPKRPAGTFAIGKTLYDSMLRHQYLLTADSDSLYEFARAAFAQTVKELEAMAAVMDSVKTWRQIADIVKQQGPTPARMIYAHQVWVDKSKDHILQYDLIPIPWKERVNVVPRAEYLRKTSYYGNFSLAKSKGPDSVYTSEWLINPFEEQWDEKRKQEFLKEHDWGVIMVTAPHETYGGHHIQGLYQMHNPRKIRRENGISIFSEGWGLYNEQMMTETGFFNKWQATKFRQLQLRLWRIARVIYDTGLHTERMTYDEAVKLMTDEVGFLPWAAQLEVDAATASPGYFIGYYTGMAEILKLREDFKRVRGNDFSLKDFHERLLKAGNMPPALMREALFNSLKVAEE